MNVLLITFSFPPAGGVGVLRALSFARYLPEMDVRVDVLTARNAPSVGRDESLLAQVPASVTVHRTWTLDLPFALRKAIKTLVSGGGKGGGKGAAKAAAPAAGTQARSAGNPLKRLLGNLLLPDPQIGWLPFAFRAAKRIIRTRGIDAVLITVPPFSSARLVTRLRQAFPHLPIVLDFRDEWLTTTLHLVSFNNNERARAVAYRTEAEAVRDATRVVLVTGAARRELIARYPQESPEKFLHIANGFESKGERRDPGQPDPLGRVRLTYMGSVYGSTDPSSFVEAVLALPDEVRRKMAIRFIGHVETPALRASLLRLGEILELKGFLPREEALRALDETEYLLLITHDRINVSAKFYDYLSAGKPIVAVLHPEGEIRRLLEQTRTGRWSDINDPDSIASLLAGIASGQQGEFDPDASQIAGYHRRALARQYAELLHEITAR